MNDIYTLPDHVLYCMNKIKENNRECYLVGGCVRDFLLQKESHDFDLTTSCHIDHLRSIFRKDCIINRNGIKHNTITIHFDDMNVEITSFRHEESEENSLYSDAMHRDFTINSIYFDEEIIDPVNGVEDLNNKLIRSVNPKLTIQEDPLRILRALRFASTLNFEIEEKTSNAIFKYAYLLKKVSVERKREELIKILKGKNMKKVMLKYHDIIFEVIPELKSTYQFDQHNPYHDEDIYSHLLSVVENVSEENKIPALFHDIGKPDCFTLDDKGVGHFYAHAYKSREISEDILERLRFPHKTIKKYLYLIENHDATIAYNENSVRKNLAKAKNIDDFLLLLDLINADKKSHTKQELLDIDKIKEIINNFKEPCLRLRDLAINGNDLKNHGFKGKEIGDALSDILDAVLNGNVINDRDELLKYLKIK